MQTSQGRGAFSDSTRGVMVVVVLLLMIEVGECTQQKHAAATNI